MANILKKEKSKIIKEAEEIYKSITKYQGQNEVLIDSLKDDVGQASSNLKDLIVVADDKQRENIENDLKQEFIDSLSGYRINRSKYGSLENVDIEEINEVTKDLKEELNNNKDFFLKGDFNFNFNGE